MAFVSSSPPLLLLLPPSLFRESWAWCVCFWRFRERSKQITHLVKGKAFHKMEDYVVAKFREVDDNELGLFAIFDGHLSHKVFLGIKRNKSYQELMFLSNQWGIKVLMSFMQAMGGEY